MSRRGFLGGLISAAATAIVAAPRIIVPVEKPEPVWEPGLRPEDVAVDEAPSLEPSGAALDQFTDFLQATGPADEWLFKDLFAGEQGYTLRRLITPA